MTECTTPSDVMADHYDDLEPLARRAAGAVARKFNIDADDLTQEGLLWCLTHPEKFMEYWGDENRNRGIGRLGRAMRNACKDFAAKQALGADGDQSDQHWYRDQTLESLLAVVYDREAWLSPPETDAPRSRGTDPAEGNGWVATLADVSYGLMSLSELDQWLLRVRYFERYTEEAIGIASEPRVSQRTAGRRVHRALKALHEALGGSRPRHDPAEEGWEGYVGTRRVVTNAQALAITARDAGFDGPFRGDH